MLFKIAATIALISTSALATEVDNFSMRDFPVDATPLLDRLMNDALEKAAEQTPSCDLKALQTHVLKPLGGPFFPVIEQWASNNSAAVSLPIEQSIYASIKSRMLWTRGVRFKKFYTPANVRIGNAIVGADKLGHFLQNGYENYLAAAKKDGDSCGDIRPFTDRILDSIAGVPRHLRRTRLKRDALVLDFSNYTENGAWGLTADGVKSYGDIAANFEGYKFWKSLAGRKNPYFVCRQNRWHKIRHFTWSDYVSEAWDEAINCSEFSNGIRSRVEAGIARVAPQGCPIRPASCIELVQKYGVLSAGLLSPKCLAAAAAQTQN